VAISPLIIPSQEKNKKYQNFQKLSKILVSMIRYIVFPLAQVCKQEGESFGQNHME
jgi:Na+/H+ antiporter NhaA